MRIINLLRSNAAVRMVPTTSDVLDRAVRLYVHHQDKVWGLADCISFISMWQSRLTSVLTLDHHFTQAGFQIHL